MADIDFDDFDAGYMSGQALPTRRYDRLLHLAGAATSVVLLVGAIWWGYQLAVRDVTGVPVMRAFGGAMRVAPADPGGDVTGHQGLSVNAVAAAGTSAPLPDQLFLAPAPQELSAEDAAGLAQPVVAANLEAKNDVPAADMTSTNDAQLVATEIPTADQDAVAAALAQALQEPEIQTAPAAVQVASAGTVRPMARPTTQTVAGALSAAPISESPAEIAIAEPQAAPATTAPAEADPSTIAAGTRLVQLGAYDDAEMAKSDWGRLSERFPELMAGKTLVVQPAQSGGRTFYRLRAVGFADEDESRRFCTALLAENATCIPVTQR